MHCIHYASSLYGKLGDKMTGRFNQDLPKDLQMAFEKATNFEPRIIMKQSINSRKIHIHIDVGPEDEIEINKAHIRNPNYKGKNYYPNFAQNRLKNTVALTISLTTIIIIPSQITNPQINIMVKLGIWTQQVPPAGKTSQCVSNTTWTG